MNTQFPSAFRCLLLLAPAALAGCTFLEDLYSGSERDSRPEPVPLEARPVEEPIARNYFVLESGTQSVIGMPQIVYTDEENTFSDLAREYGLGYDEMVAANPEVDPWLPADGIDWTLTDIMLGYWTQFAKTGDPNREGLPHWPIFDPTTGLHQDLGDEVHSATGLQREFCKTLDRGRI